MSGPVAFEVARGFVDVYENAVGVHDNDYENFESLVRNSISSGCHGDHAPSTNDQRKLHRSKFSSLDVRP